jgi:long-chain fatty acid transport protein
MDMDVTKESAGRSMSIQVIRMALLCLLVAVPAHAQIVETVGSRALGMGGAFGAVASDSSATWWNPAGLAAGPFVDVAWGKGVIETNPGLPAVRYRPSWVALGTAARGGVYRFRITDIQRLPIDASSTADKTVGLECRRSLSVTQVSATVLRTVAQGIHVGPPQNTSAEQSGQALGRESDPVELRAPEELEVVRQRTVSTSTLATGCGRALSIGRRAKCQGAKVWKRRAASAPVIQWLPVSSGGWRSVPRTRFRSLRWTRTAAVTPRG